MCYVWVVGVSAVSIAKRKATTEKKQNIEEKKEKVKLIAESFIFML